MIRIKKRNQLNIKANLAWNGLLVWALPAGNAQHLPVFFITTAPGGKKTHQYSGDGAGNTVGMRDASTQHKHQVTAEQEEEEVERSRWSRGWNIVNTDCFLKCFLKWQWNTSQRGAETLSLTPVVSQAASTRLSLRFHFRPHDCGASEPGN